MVKIAPKWGASPFSQPVTVAVTDHGNSRLHFVRLCGIPCVAPIPDDGGSSSGGADEKERP
jgi:hypothetical protein